MSVEKDLLDGSINPINALKVAKFKIDFIKEHPDFFNPDGLLIFCGSQGSGKTLSVVQYASKCLLRYDMCIFCTNVEIKEFPTNCYYKFSKYKNANGIEICQTNYYLINGDDLVRSVKTWFENGEQQCEIEDSGALGFNGHIVVEYNGIDCIKELQNGIYGVLYLIDEIHLEFNSLESKNIPIEIMIEVSQQRKQRKHIIGTSQVYMRLAKPLREQISNVVICKNFFKCIQFNRLIDGESSHEEDGKLVYDTTQIKIWFHSPKLYKSYDTYKKMKRYRDEWKGVSRQNVFDNQTNINVINSK
ncbi:MAG: ATP-binding protein [Clostridia bacterium]|nr:ATP-binding protein [Clostridia bacterium]